MSINGQTACPRCRTGRIVVDPVMGGGYCANCGVSLSAYRETIKNRQEREREQQLHCQQTSRRLEASRPRHLDDFGVPLGLGHCWSWPAFLFGWWWCLCHRLPGWGLLSLIGGPIVSIILGLNGNRYAYRVGRYSSIASYRRSQRRWELWARVVLWTLALLCIAALAIWGEQDYNSGRAILDPSLYY